MAMTEADMLETVLTLIDIARDKPTREEIVAQSATFPVPATPHPLAERKEGRGTYILGKTDV